MGSGGRSPLLASPSSLWKMTLLQAHPEAQGLTQPRVPLAPLQTLFSSPNSVFNLEQKLVVVAAGGVHKGVYTLAAATLTL